MVFLRVRPRQQREQPGAGRQGRQRRGGPACSSHRGSPSAGTGRRALAHPRLVQELKPPRSLTACGRCPPRGPSPPWGGPAAGWSEAPTLPHCVWSLPPKGAQPALGRPGGGLDCWPPRSLTSCGRCPPGRPSPPWGGSAAGWTAGPHAPSLRVVAAPQGGPARLRAAGRRADLFVAGLLIEERGLTAPVLAHFVSLAAPQGDRSPLSGGRVAG